MTAHCPADTQQWVSEGQHSYLGISTKTPHESNLTLQIAKKTPHQSNLTAGISKKTPDKSFLTPAHSNVDLSDGNDDTLYGNVAAWRGKVEWGRGEGDLF